MSRARTFWKWTAITVGTLLVLLVGAVASFRFWIDHSPELAPEIVARVEKLTGLTFAFRRLDARLGWLGPELVFREARISVPGQRDALVTARAGRVGFDLWRAIRTGRIASARVVLDGARVDLYITQGGRVELRGQGDLGEGDGGARLSVAQLPVGRVRIEDSTVTLQDLRTHEHPLHVDRVYLDLDHLPGLLSLKGHVQLPDALGAGLDADARLEGDLDTPATLGWRAEVSLKRAALAGWTSLVPQWPWLPAAGTGNLTVSAAGRGAAIDRARAQFALADVTTRATATDPAAHLKSLAGVVDVVRSGERWTATGRALQVDPGHDAWRNGEFDLTLGWQSGALQSVQLRSPAIRLDALAALAALLPDGTVREAGLALAPRGQLSQVNVTAAHGTTTGEWRIDGALRFTGLATGPWRAVPGIGGISGDVAAQGDHGRIRVASGGLGLALPRVFPGPFAMKAAHLSLDWWWRPDGWRFATDDLDLHSADFEARGKARFWLPADPEESPRLVLDLEAANIDTHAAPRYLPIHNIPPKSLAWLSDAFVAGRLPHAHIEFAGDVRRFPFRTGGGGFRARANFEGVQLHYQDGFTDIDNASGEVDFHNQGVTIHAPAARVGKLAISDAHVAIDDFFEADIVAHAQAKGDVRDGLAFLQGSPVGPKLGSFFMKVAGQGGLTASVALDLPLNRFAERQINVDGRLAGASALLPGLKDEVRDISGPFSLHNRELDVPQMTATMLGGGARLKARTITGPSGRPGDRVLVVEAQGRASGERLQPVLGITRGSWLEGQTDWRAEVRMPRLEWRPPDEPVPADAPPGAHPKVHEMEIRSLPGTIHLESTLAGLGSALPAPLAKAAEEARGLKVDVQVDPGLAADAPTPPAFWRRRDLARPATLLARLQVGRAASALEWRDEGSWRLSRGTLRLGGGAAELRDAKGVWLEGRMAEYDLSAWLRVHLSAEGGHGLGEYLRGGQVSVGRFGIFGYHFADVRLTLEGRDSRWHVAVEGPSARGTIVVPWELPGTAPLVLDMDHLVLGPRETGGGEGETTDPTQLPSMAITVRDLEIQKRRFGSLEAQISRTDDGLRLDRATLKGASFEGSAKGSWLLAGGAQRTVLTCALDSTDLLDTLNAWGFEPTLTGKSGHATGELHWPGGVDGDVLGRIAGNAKVVIEQGQLMSVEPGAGRVLGLMSVTALPRHLSLDFSDLTDKGFAFDTIKGDFEFREGNAYTNNLTLKGPAAEIGIVGRTGLVARDYDQTAKVTGRIGGPLAAAGALAAGPVVGAAVLLFSTVFKEPLGGLTRGYYRITGAWDKPKVERIGAGQAREAAESGTPPPELPPAAPVTPH